MKTTIALTLAGLFLFATCGSSDSSRLRADPDVQAILAEYRELDATDEEIDELVEMLDDALDVYDNEAERRAYLQDMRAGLEESTEQIEDFRESEGVEP